MNENSTDKQHNNESTKQSSFISNTEQNNAINHTSSNLEMNPAESNTEINQTDLNIPINHTFRTIKKRMPWSEEEDNSIKSLVKKYGTSNWTLISNKMGQNRSGKQCRERWYNQLNPNMNKDNWTEKEEIILFTKQMQLGNKWADIASSLPGRTLTDIKNHFYSKLRKFIRKILNQINEENLFKLNGIDGCKYTGEKIYKMIKEHEINYRNLTKNTVFEMIIATEKNKNGNCIFNFDNSKNAEYNSNYSIFTNNSNNLGNNFIYNDIKEEMNGREKNVINKNIINKEFLNNKWNNLQLITQKINGKILKEKKDKIKKKSSKISENNPRLKYKFKKIKNTNNINLNDMIKKDNSKNLLNINQDIINEKGNYNQKKKDKKLKDNTNIIKNNFQNKENNNKLIGLKRKKFNIINSNNYSPENGKSNFTFQLHPSFKKNNNNSINKKNLNKELFLSEIPTFQKKEKTKRKKKKLKLPLMEEIKDNEICENNLKEIKLKSKLENKENNYNYCFYPPFKITTPKAIKNIQFPSSETKSNKSLKPEDFSFNKMNLINDYLDSSQMQQLFPISFENILLCQQKNKNIFIPDLSVDNNLLKSKGSLNGSIRNDNTFKNFSIDGNLYNKFILQNNMNNNICADDNTNSLEEKNDINVNKKNENGSINLEFINHQDFTNTVINGNIIGGNESQYNTFFNKNNPLNIYNSSPSSMKSIWK